MFVNKSTNLVFALFTPRSFLLRRSFTCQSMSTPSSIFQNPHETCKANIVYLFKIQTKNAKNITSQIEIETFQIPYTSLTSFQFKL